MARAPLVLRAERVVVPGAVLSPGELILHGARIGSVGPAPRRPAPTPGSILVPGFVDLQVNGAGRYPVPALRDDDSWNEIGDALVQGGTTTWCATVLSGSGQATSATIGRIAARIARRPRRSVAPAAGTATTLRGPHRLGPTLAGAHLEGPFLAVPGAHPPCNLRDRVPSRWAASMPSAVRVVTLAPELPGAMAAIRTLSSAGVTVALGHSRCTAEIAHGAAGCGARLVTHLGNAMGQLHQREPGLIGAALSDDRLAVSVIADLMHVHPDLLRLSFAAKGASGVVLVTDRVADIGTASAPGAAGSTTAGGSGGASPGARRGASPGTGGDASPGARARPPTGLTRTLPGGGLTGTSAGMVDMLAGCVLGAGVDLAAATAAATETPARLLGLRDRGVLAPGRRADVVELVESGGWFRVRRVWVAGAPVERATPGAALPAHR